MIVFHSPTITARTQFGRNLTASTIILTTQEGSEADGLGLSVRTGGLGWSSEASKNRPSPRRSVTRWPSATGAVPVTLSPEQFASLWRDLASLGVFSLPEHPRSDPPTDQPYFLLESKRLKRIFLRPQGVIPGADSPEEYRRLIKIWSGAKLRVFQMLRGAG